MCVRQLVEMNSHSCEAVIIEWDRKRNAPHRQGRRRPHASGHDRSSRPHQRAMGAASVRASPAAQLERALYEGAEASDQGVERP